MQLLHKNDAEYSFDINFMLLIHQSFIKFLNLDKYSVGKLFILQSNSDALSNS